MQEENSVIVACITDPYITTKKLEFRITYKNESIYLIHQPFDYENSNGVFMNLKPQEEYPLHIGTVIQMGSKTQYLVERFNTGLIASSGKRNNMEDSFIAIQDIRLHPMLPISVYGVFDGHGGEWCAQFLRKNVEAEVKKNLLDPKEGMFGIDRGGFNECVGKALKKTFQALDEDFLLKEEKNANKCGSTAVLILVIGAHIFCANVGDSRAVISREGVAHALSLDHKPSRADEAERITREEGNIEFGRVLGKLAVTRAVGDFEFKLIYNLEG